VPPPVLCQGVVFMLHLVTDTRKKFSHAKEQTNALAVEKLGLAFHSISSLKQDVAYCCEYAK
jgi:hypothetical protein